MHFTLTTFITVSWGALVPLILISMVSNTLAHLPDIDWTLNLTQNGLFSACRDGMQAAMLIKNTACPNTLQVTEFMSSCQVQALWDAVSLLNGCGAKYMILRASSKNQTCLRECIDTLYENSKLCLNDEHPLKPCFKVALSTGADCAYNCRTGPVAENFGTCMERCHARLGIARRMCRAIEFMLFDVCKSITPDIRSNCYFTCHTRYKARFIIR